VVEGLPAGDGELPAGDGLSPDGDGLPAGDGELTAGDGELTAGDGELPAGDGELPAGDGEGLSANAHTLSAVAEPALLSTSVVALQVVQFVQVFWLDAVENFPVEHATQVRSVVAVPLAAIFWPALQVVQAVHEPSFTSTEYFPVPQGVHTRSVVLVPFEETYFPAVHGVHAEHDRGVDGGNKDSVTSVTSCAFPNSPVGHPVPQRTPSFVLVCAVHVPAKGETVQGLEVQFVGLTYLSAPPLLPSYP